MATVKVIALSYTLLLTNGEMCRFTLEVWAFLQSGVSLCPPSGHEAERTVWKKHLQTLMIIYFWFFFISILCWKMQLLEGFPSLKKERGKTKKRALTVRETNTN